MDVPEEETLGSLQHLHPETRESLFHPKTLFSTGPENKGGWLQRQVQQGCSDDSEESKESPGAEENGEDAPGGPKNPVVYADEVVGGHSGGDQGECADDLENVQGVVIEETDSGGEVADVLGQPHHSSPGHGQE